MSSVARQKTTRTQAKKIAVKRAGAARKRMKRGKRMESFKEQKMKRERGSTPREALQSLLDNAETIDNIIVVVDHDGGNLDTVISCDDTLSVLGMLEVAKDDTLTIMKDDKD